VAREVREVADFFGQEQNRTTYNLARMNMILHGVHYRNFDLRQEDTLEHPQHEGMTFEAIVANPPFSAKWSAREMFRNDDRFAPYGRLAPASKADYAFVTHMLHHLDENGVMAIVLPHGALFRGAAEGAIREFIVKEKNWLDAVIGLPENIFYGTGIPACIMVFRKCREVDDVLFVDASAGFGRGKNQNFLRPGDIDRIVGTYRDRAEHPRYSHRAPRAEIAENGYNLNIPRYVDTYVAPEQVDLAAVARELKVIDQEMGTVDAEIRRFCAELGLEAPV
jgi:type I restriction enzyme M protein